MSHYIHVLYAEDTQEFFSKDGYLSKFLADARIYKSFKAAEKIQKMYAAWKLTVKTYECFPKEAGD